VAWRLVGGMTNLAMTEAYAQEWLAAAAHGLFGLARARHALGDIGAARAAATESLDVFTALRREEAADVAALLSTIPG
jgi:hypothetical protein